MVELENDYYLLKKLCEESQSFGFPEVIDILQQFNFQREVKKYERFVSNYREFSKNKLFETYEYLKLKDLSNKNEFKSFVLRYGNSNEKIDFGKKNKSVKKDDLHNKENVKKEIDDKEMFLTILLPSHTG